MTRARPWGVPLVLALVLSGAALVAGPRGDNGAERRAAAVRYADAVRPILGDGGRVITLGVKPALTDYSAGKSRPDQLRMETRAWQSALASVADRLAAVPAPEFLATARVRYLDALARYMSLARRLEEVSDAPAAARPSYVDQVAAIGGEADRVYDEADALVRDALDH